MLRASGFHTWMIIIMLWLVLLKIVTFVVPGTMMKNNVLVSSSSLLFSWYLKLLFSLAMKKLRHICFSFNKQSTVMLVNLAHYLLCKQSTVILDSKDN